MLIRDLFVSDVTRDIPPVVYFHEQSAEKVQAEVSEYIITGGWSPDHPNHKRVSSGIHEAYVNLLSAITTAIKGGDVALPNSWISGFYGSGKSSFAKLLGLALDGMALPSGGSLAEALLKRDTSQRRDELRAAWKALREIINPLAVVFDVGSVARENDQIHTAALRELQKRLGYCSTEPLVADFELRLERDGVWPRFLEAAERVLKEPWSKVKDQALAEDKFSHVMHALEPTRYTDPLAWFDKRAGTDARANSPEEVVTAIRDMLKFRRDGATLFFVVDEVSQYVLSSRDRVDRLRAFATAIGKGLKGKAWLFALGQQRLEEESDERDLGWLEDRFPDRFRVHLSTTNIRDVVHKRLLQKKPEVEATLKDHFERHRNDLKLFAYKCENLTLDDFVDVYPMLPEQVDLFLEITSALRSRSTRAQGDAQAIRGLLQLLGELFRTQKIADQEVGSLVTLDQVYEIQATALESDVQVSMGRILAQCVEDPSSMWARAAKAVALLQLIQARVPTDAKFVAQCLYDRLDRGPILEKVTEALEELRRRNLLGYSEKEGYKIQSSAGEEWERERREIGVGRDTISEIVHDALRILVAEPDRPRLKGRPFPWMMTFSDGRRLNDASLGNSANDTAVRVDLRFVTTVEEHLEAAWIKKSNEAPLSSRIVWVSGDTDRIEEVAKELARSRGMVRTLDARKESLAPAKKMLLQGEKNRLGDLEREIATEVRAAWHRGVFYFRGLAVPPEHHGTTFASALHKLGETLLPKLFPHFTDLDVEPGELTSLLLPDLAGLSPKFLQSGLDIFGLEGSRYAPTCNGVVPRRVQEFIEKETVVSGQTLLAHFARPPYAYPGNVVKACVIGLFRGARVEAQPEAGGKIIAHRDPGFRDVFERERDFKRAEFVWRTGGTGIQGRAQICQFLEDAFPSLKVDREEGAIADFVAEQFPAKLKTVREVFTRLNSLSGVVRPLESLLKLEEKLGACIAAARRTDDAVKQVKASLDILRDGLQALAVLNAELNENTVELIRDLVRLRDYQIPQLDELGLLNGELKDSSTRITAQLTLDKPWRDIIELEGDRGAILAAYSSARATILDCQEQETEKRRSALKTRDGFSTLTRDQEHAVLRPFATAPIETTAEAIAPSLKLVAESFHGRLERAWEEANEKLDSILSEGDRPVVRKIELSLKNREVSTEAEVEGLVSEIRERLLEQVRQGLRVRIA